MADRKIRFMAATVLTLAAFSAGCDMLPHNMQPHRLWRLNRGQQLGRDPYFSVPDRIPTRAEATAEINSHEIDLGLEEISFGPEAELK